MLSWDNEFSVGLRVFRTWLLQSVLQEPVLDMRERPAATPCQPSWHQQEITFANWSLCGETGEVITPLRQRSGVSSIQWELYTCTLPDPDLITSVWSRSFLIYLLENLKLANRKKQSGKYPMRCLSHVLNRLVIHSELGETFIPCLFYTTWLTTPPPA